MRIRDRLHHVIGAALGLHHEDPVVQQIAGLRRIGGLVYGLEDEVHDREKAIREQLGPAECAAQLQRAWTYYRAAEGLVTIADAFVLDAFSDPEHPKHLPQVTFVQAKEWYAKIPDLVTAVRREIAYPQSGQVPLPVLLGTRIEAPGRCPIEHLLAMQRAANQIEEVLGTRIELLRQQGADAPIRRAVLLMAEAPTKKESADQVIGAIRRGDRVPEATHEQAESYYYDGVLRSYLYAAQELEWPGVTEQAPGTENSEEENDEPRGQVIRFPGQIRGSGLNQALGLGGFDWGTLLTVDVIANVASELLSGLFNDR